MRLNHSLTHRWDSLSADEMRHRQGAVLHRYLKHTVVPFSAHYSELFRDSDIDPDEIRSVDDLAKIPFSSKRTLVSEDGTPKTRDFVLIPDEQVLAKRPSTILRALYRGRSG